MRAYVYVEKSICRCLVVELCLTLCNPMDCSTPGLPVLYYLPELAQTHVHWCHVTFLSSASPFSSRLQSFPASGSFPVSQLFTSGGQRIGASASALMLPMNIQGWFPLGLNGLISFLSKGLSSVFSSTTVQKHQFFGPQLSWFSNSHIHPYVTTEKPQLWRDRPLLAK